jgi:hypothetical protein
LPGRPSGREIAELWCSENGCVIPILRAAFREQEIGVVKKIEELRTKFQIRLF